MIGINYIYKFMRESKLKYLHVCNRFIAFLSCHRIRRRVTMESTLSMLFNIIDTAGLPMTVSLVIKCIMYLITMYYRYSKERYLINIFFQNRKNFIYYSYIASVLFILACALPNNLIEVISKTPPTNISSPLEELTDGNYARIYTPTNSGLVVYKDINLTTQGMDGKASSEAIVTADEEIRILKINTNGAGITVARIDYKHKDKRSEAYVALKDLIFGDCMGETFSAQADVKGFYRRPHSNYERNWCIDKGDILCLLSEKDQMMQIMYKINGGWRIAWCTKTQYEQIAGK